MKLWMKRISVFLITFMTLGLYTPPVHLNTEASNEGIFTEKSNTNDDIATPVMDVVDEIDYTQESDTTEYIINSITEQAKEQTVAKLGPRIINQIEPDMVATILPNIEVVLQMILADAGEDQINYYALSEEATPGYGEKIFNIHDFRTKTDVARFDVRRVNRPGEGYWFNFHYHLSQDGFEEHHDIGEVYWNKNMPPKWMA